MFFDKLFNRYVRHGLSVVGGILIAKGVDAEAVNQTTDAVVNLSGAVATVGMSLIMSYISDKIKIKF